MKKPLVSIIVAVYNGAKYLPKCVDSILGQSYDNLEVILVDDGSPDECPFICDEFAKKDKRIKVIHQKNAGTCTARNNGLKLSSGDYICIMDQDDYIDKDYIQYLVGLCIKNDVNIALIPSVIFVKGTQKLYRDKKPASAVEIYDGEKAACEMLYMNIDIGPWNKIISRKIIDENDLRFNSELFGGEGFEFSVKCFMHTDKIAVGHKGGYYYRVDNYESEMSDFRVRTAKSSFKAIGIMRDNYYGKAGKLDKALDYASWEVYSVFLSSMIFARKEKEYSNEYKNYKKELRRNFKWKFLVCPAPIKHRLKNFLCMISPKCLRFVMRVANAGIREYNK